MLLESQDFYTIIQNDTCVPLKQKIFSFHEQFTSKKSKARRKNNSALGLANPEYPIQMQKNHFALRPKLPAKKLVDQPRFFMSLQRKRVRIIDGLKNVPKIQSRPSTSTSLRSARGMNLKKHQSNQCKQESQRLSKSALYDEMSNSASSPTAKTPFLNYNLQYLIKKRKMMTPVPQSLSETISFFNRSKN